MLAMPARSLLILNPRSRGGATGRRALELETKLGAALGSLEVERTRGPRDAERIAREAVRAGVENLIVGGGDGTINEVVSGLLEAGLGGYATLGLLPLGTGGDLMRTLELPRDLDAAIQRIAHGKPRCIDAGCATYRSRDGEKVRSFFLNVGSIGISGLVTELVNRAPKRLGPRVSYVLGTVRAIARWEPTPVRLHVDGSLVHEGPFSFTAAANGRYFGGGMLVAPQANVDDGVLDIVVIPCMTRRAMLRHFPKIYRGAHVREPGVAQHCARRLDATSEALVWIEIDGEPLGQLPACFEVVPKAVRIAGAGE
jgi:YegS/Rv2252/BmrU family lipid kinase